MDEYSRNAVHVLQAHLQASRLHAFSSRLQAQFKDKLLSSEICMLPSYRFAAPSGHESGTFVALDVGGSTLRVALVHLHASRQAAKPTHTLRHRGFPIDDAVRQLDGRAFFTWLAMAIRDTLMVKGRGLSAVESPISLGVAWSFPVEQLSLRDALLLQMGKGFRATDTLLRCNLADLIEEACRMAGLNISVEAVINDGPATLLAHTYAEGAAGLSIILGTGLNAAIELPTAAFGPSKLPLRSGSVSSQELDSERVIVNTEVSMFGGDILPQTVWDIRLNEMLPHPGFQPLEYFLSGRCIGEIVRLILAEAIGTTGLFYGETPTRFQAYELETSTVALVESDDSITLHKAASLLEQRHPLPSKRPHTLQDIHHVRNITKAVSDRAAAYFATAIHALWMLKLDLDFTYVEDSFRNNDVSVSCNGSIVVKYHHFKERVQAWLDTLTNVSDSGAQRLLLHTTGEEQAVLLGAAVTVAVARTAKLSKGSSRL